MGLMDFFRRRPQRAAGVDDELEAFLKREDSPRPQYYTFAHYVLRQATFQLGAACLGVLVSPRREEFLRTIWDAAADSCRQTDPSVALDPFPAASIQVAPLRAGPFPCAVVKMPPPRGTTECHLVGIVAHVDIAAGEEPTEQTAVSYFTLEQGASLDGSARTVLCEWTREGSHLNFGGGPPAEPEAFANAIGQKLAGRGYEPRAAMRPPTE